MSQGRVAFYGVAVVYLLGVVVQFFLAGLAVFGVRSYDAHRGLGFALALLSLVLLVLAIGARMPRSATALSAVLVGLNAFQIILIQLDIAEVNALHLVNALAIAFVANMLVHRSRRVPRNAVGDRLALEQRGLALADADAERGKAVARRRGDGARAGA